MFKHILIPTDGSAVSAKAVKAGIALAKESGARVTGYYALEPVPALLRLHSVRLRARRAAVSAAVMAFKVMKVS